MRLFVFIGGLIVLVLLAALIGPYFVDWSEYRTRFEAEASRILGQDVRVEGAASARLLPFPSVTFSNVQVGPKDQPNMTVETFSMDAELAPFLSGEVLIFDMRLVSPVIRLDLDEEGRPQWPWPSDAPLNPAQVILENAQFSDGTIILRDPAGGRQWDFVALNGVAAAQNLYGPWRVETKGLVRGNLFEARINTGGLSAAGFSVRINAALPEQKIQITTEGRIAPPTDDIKSWYSGTFKLEPDDKLATNYLLEGVFEADARSLDVAQFRGDFGDLEDPYTINGSASIIGGETPRFTLKAKGNQVSIGNDDGDEKPVSINDRLSALQSVLSALPFPPVDGKIDLDLPTIVAGNTTIRDFRLTANPAISGEGRVWRIANLNAKLPGRTVLEAKGDLTLAATGQDVHQNAFMGDIVLASRQPSGFALWLTEDIDDTIRSLPNAGFAARVKLNSDAQIFENIELILGQAQLNGRIERRAGANILPYLSLELNGAGARYETLQALSAVVLGSDGTMRQTNHDIDVALDLTDARIADIDIGQIDTQFRIRENRVEVDRASLRDIFGAALSGTGTFMRGDQSQGGQRANWDISIIAPQGASVVKGLSSQFSDMSGLKMFGKTARRDPNAFSDMALNIVGSALFFGAENIEASASVSGGMGGSEISLITTMLGSFDAPENAEATLSGTINNDEVAMLMSQMGFEVLPLQGLGEGQTQLNFSGSLRDGMSANIAVKTDDSLIASDGIFRATPKGISFNGAAKVAMQDAEPWWDLFGYIFPYTGLGTSLNINSSVDYDAGALLMSDLKGDIAENAFSGALNFEFEPDRRKMGGDLSIDAFDIGFWASLIAGRYDLTDQAALYSQPLYDDHQVDLKIGAAELSALDTVFNEAKLRLVYRDGSLSLRDVSARYGEQGRIAGSLDVQNTGGSILFNSQAAVEDIDLSKLVAIPNLNAKASGGFSLSLTGTGKSTEALIGSLTGSGVLGLDQAQLAGLNLQAIEPIIAQADAIGYEITDGQIDDIAASSVLNGVIDLPPAQLPISISSGRANIANMAYALDGATLTGSLSLEMGSQTLSGDGRMTYDAGEERLIGTQPEVVFDIQQDKAGAAINVSRDFTTLASFVRQRALEKEQARVEALQARLLEKQRLRRQVRYLKYVERQAQARLEQERLEQERQEQERLEQERQEALKEAELNRQAELEKQRQAELRKAQEEKRKQEQAEKEAARIEAERQAALRREAEKKEAERIQAVKARERAAALEREVEQELKAERQAAQLAERQSQAPASNAVDDALINDPFAPLPNASNIFKDLDFQN